MRRSCAVLSICLICIVAKSWYAEEGPHTHSRTQQSLWLLMGGGDDDAWAGDQGSAPGGTEVGCPSTAPCSGPAPRWHGPRLRRAPSCVYVSCFQDTSAHCSGSTGSLTSVLATANRLCLPWAVMVVKDKGWVWRQFLDRYKGCLT